MIILVCGGRDYNDAAQLIEVLNNFDNRTTAAGDPVTHVIHGDAHGADTLARGWAVTRGIQPVACPALWEVYPRRGPGNAGRRRNRAMLQLTPHTVIAFPGGPGTAHIVSITEAAIKSWLSLKRRPQDLPFHRIHRLIKVDKNGLVSYFPSVR